MVKPWASTKVRTPTSASGSSVVHGPRQLVTSRGHAYPFSSCFSSLKKRQSVPLLDDLPPGWI